MSLADVVLAVMFVGVTAYALFGGADFGAGIWDLLAGGTAAGRKQRDLIELSLAPVWEANHVWLIFVLVVLWTAFPPAFAAFASTLYIPLTLAAIGMIARGSAFAFRKTVTDPRMQRFFGIAFAFSSLFTPFFLGAIVGGIASGRVPPGIAQGDVITSWLHPTAALGGLMSVGACAYLAAVYLCRDAQREAETEALAQFRLRALMTGGLLGVLAVIGVFVLRADAPELFDGLIGRGLPLMVVSALGGIATLRFVFRGQYVPARIAAAIAVTAVLWGWGAGQYPYILASQLTIDDAAAGRSTLTAMLVSMAIGSLILVPSLIYLFAVFQRPARRATAPQGFTGMP